MTNENQELPSYNIGGDLDVFGASAVSVLSPRLRPRNKYRVVRNLRNRETGEVFAFEWEIIQRDWSGGAGVYQGPYELVNNFYSSADGANLTIPGYAFCPHLVSAYDTTVPTGTLAGFHSANIFGTLIFGLGSGNDVALYKETSSSDPTPTPITGVGTAGRPGAVITCLSTAVLNNADERLIMGRDGSAALVVGDASGTIDATMDASTNSTWGVIRTWLPHEDGGFYVLFYAGENPASISYIRSDVAETTALTSATPDVPAGGCGLGVAQLEGFPPRAYWLIPREENGTGALALGSEKLMQVRSTALNGQDMQVLDFNDMPLGVKSAVIIPRGIVATDGERVVLHTGQTEINLNILRDTLQSQGIIVNSGFYWRCRGFSYWGDDLYAHMVLIDADASVGGTNAQQWSLWKLNWDTLHWHMLSAWKDAGASVNADRVVLPAGPMPISHTTHFVHLFTGLTDNDFFYRMFIPSPGENAFTLYRQVGSNSDASAQEYETGVFDSPRWSLPEGDGYPHVIKSIAVQGDVNENGGNDSDVRINIARQSGFGSLSFSSNIVDHTFNDAHDTTRWRYLNRKDFPHNTDFFYQLAMEVALDAGTTTTKTPAIFSIHINGLTYLDGKVRTPVEAYAEAGIPYRA